MKLAADVLRLSAGRRRLLARPQSQGGLTLEKKLPAAFAQLSNVVELARRPRRVRRHQGEAVPRRRPRRRGKVDTLGTRVDSLIANAPPEQYKFPGWVAHLGRRHRRAGGLQRASAPRSGTRRASRSACCRSPEVAGHDAGAGLRHGRATATRSTTRRCSAAAEPGQPVRPDSVPVLRIDAQDGQGGHGGEPRRRPSTATPMFGEQIQQAAKVFAPNDFFGVLPNGTAWLARGHENRVDWRSPEGRWTAGTAPRLRPRRRHPGRPRPGAGAGARAGQAVRHAAGPADRVSVRRHQAAVRLRAGPAERRGLAAAPARAGGRAAHLRRVRPAREAGSARWSFPPGATLAGFGRKGAVYGRSGARTARTGTEAR